MGKVTGFREFERVTTGARPAADRVGSWGEFSIPLPIVDLQKQGARCMDCGVPFCQSDTGCPLGNRIPEWNDLVHAGRWREALEHLHATNNFPEFTGRVCPAPCESACVLGIHQPPVAIKTIEQALADRGFDEGWITPQPPARATGRTVAVVGSGPAGLAAAQQLARSGHAVTVYERDERPGGLLTFGIPAMKLGKGVVERRLDQMRAEGVTFRTGVEIGRDVSVDRLRDEYDAVLLATGATVPRDLPVPGRSLEGVHFAMEYLAEATRAHLAGSPDAAAIHARDRHVVVIGGGDTGNDCIATAVRQGAASVTNFEIRERPPESRGANDPWPQRPWVFQVDYGHEEAAEAFGEDPRHFRMGTTAFEQGPDGRVCAVRTVEVATRGSAAAAEGAGAAPAERRWPADLVFLALGFVGPETLSADVGPWADPTRTGPDRFRSSQRGVFVAGDCRRGQSLVVTAIAEGRAAADDIHRWLAVS
ncbi:glutamate synthase subunit beta [Gaopeijia maritima]|uniref:Glutamate synthase subunit beta n=1 Tax=Gaopeijia maritima TaxID=3119007 RepID=A0ABU9E6S4_9BACT